MATITQFGKTIRKMRIEKDETMMDMAKRLDVSPSFLSSVETGRKPVPDTLVEKIASTYHLADDCVSTLRQEAAESTKTYRITPDEGDHALVAAFARKLDLLSDDQKQEIMTILRKD